MEGGVEILKVCVPLTQTKMIKANLSKSHHECIDARGAAQVAKKASGAG